MSYTIEEHNHRLAAWAASRAASVKGCRFKVRQGVAMLEACGFNKELSHPDSLPSPTICRHTHKKWREKIIEEGKRHKKTLSHGVAAKLINCYLKIRFVCAGHHDHENVKYLHPPIDDVLLKELVKTDFAGHKDEWRHFRKKRWSKLKSDTYEEVIELIRQSLQGQPLWAIEKYWKGHQ